MSSISAGLLQAARPTINRAKKQPRVAVIDDFKVRRVDINRTGDKDLPHGNAVVPVLKSEAATASLQPLIQVFTNDERVKVLTDFIPEQVDKILEECAKKGDFDAVNISAGLHKSISFLSRKTGIEDLSPDNLNKNKERIREYLLESNIDKVAKTILSLEKITDKGIKVYVAAGNKGPEYVNLFSFAKGVISVGATDANGKLLSSSACNDMLKYMVGEYSVGQEKNSSGEYQYFLTDPSGEKVRLAKPFGEHLSPYHKPKEGPPADSAKIKGTSFAAPARLAYELSR